MNTINDNISFGAKLDYKKISGNHCRWAKIAKVFEEKTKQYPKDVFILETNSEGGIYFHPKYSNTKLESKTSTWDKGEISKTSTEKLELCSAEKVADIFKRLFKMRRKNDNMLADYFSFENKYGLNDVSKDDITDKLFSEICDLRKSYAEQGVKNDKILKTWSGIDVV